MFTGFACHFPRYFDVPEFFCKGILCEKYAVVFVSCQKTKVVDARSTNMPVVVVVIVVIC